MTGRAANGLNAALERYLPERRLFLKSDTETRFIRLRPLTQAIALAGSGLVLSWTIVASAILMMDSIGSGNIREQAKREQAVYEARLNALSSERDRRAEEAAHAHERFNVALGRISEMQTALLASEDRRRELETGVNVIQNTLRTAIRERDAARTEAVTLTAALNDQNGAGSVARRSQDVAAALDYLSDALGETAAQRDQLAAKADQARAETEMLALEKRLMQDRNDQIFTRLEEAVTVSMAPLDKVFRNVGVSPEKVISQVRRGYSGQGGPLMPLSISTKGVAADADTERANTILEGLDNVNLYRLALDKLPVGSPLKGGYRLTSSFGGRADPFHGGNRRHTGIDMAGDRGTPILSTATGVVEFAGWQSGYGKLVVIRHDFGLETRYGHLSEIRVKVGQRISRGERIGDMGSTGRSTGTHLHYEVRTEGEAVNPMTYIKAASDVF